MWRLQESHFSKLFKYAIYVSGLKWLDLYACLPTKNEIGMRITREKKILFKIQSPFWWNGFLTFQQLFMLASLFVQVQILALFESRYTLNNQPLKYDPVVVSELPITGLFAPKAGASGWTDCVISWIEIFSFDVEQKHGQT